MKSVVTGGSGFIGGFIAKALAEESETNEVIIFDIAKPDFPLYKNVKYMFGDIRDRHLLNIAFNNAEEVYDCAGLLGTSELIDVSSLASETNITGAINILDACLDKDVKRIFHPTKPMFSNDYENTYTITKFCAEKFCQMYKEQFGLSIAILRWLNATGPRQHLYPIRKAVPLMCVLALNDLPLEIYGDGEQTVDIIDVRDIAEISIRACRELGDCKDIIDVGLGNKMSVNELSTMIINLVEKKTGKKCNSGIKHIAMRPGEKKNIDIVANLSNLKDLMPDFKFKYDVEECLKECITYYSGLSSSEIRNVFQFYGYHIK
jgi:nucleoside-diphosphate-sugar epimerase